MFRRRRSANDFAEEIKAHLELEADELKQEGLGEDEARRKARSEFGSITAAKEQFYTRGRLLWFDNLLRDVRFAIRQLVKNPGFTATAIFVLALGIGSTVAIFAFVDAALLKPLPYADPARLMSVNESDDTSSFSQLSYPDYLDWQRSNRSFRSLDIYNGIGHLLHTGSGIVPVQGVRVSGGFFQTLGVRPMLGRDFSPGENRLGGPNVVILSYGAWLHRFGSKPDVVGKTVDLDDVAYTIIGVLPRTFSFAPSGNAEFWLPINALSRHEYSRTFYSFFGIGRLRDGATREAATAEMTAVTKQLYRQYGITDRNESATILPFSEIVIGNVRPILLTLLAGAGLLLWIACINVGSLVLVRSEKRKREIAVRGALGATPARLRQQFVTEGVLLSVFGSMAGVIVASWFMKLLAHLVPKDMTLKMPFLEGVGLNAHVCLFVAVIVLFTTILLAAMPIFRLSFQKVGDGLSLGGRGTSGLFWRKLGSNMVVVELAVAVVLLAGAGLLGKSLYRLLHVPLGFDPSHLATVRIMAPHTAEADKAPVTNLYREILRRVTGLPGVESVGMTSILPVQCNCAIDRIHFPDRPYHGEHNDVDERHVSPAYLSTLKGRLLRGRFFSADEDASKPGLAIINQSLARKYFSGEDPIGKRIANDEGGRPSEWEIVGVVDDIRDGPLDSETWPAEYFSINQTQDRYFSLVVRTRQDEGAFLPELVSTLHRIDPDLGVSDEVTMNQKISGTQSALLHRFSAWLIGGFAATALVLGAVGLYGVIAYSVSQRTREIGVRMALGAQRQSVSRMVLREAGWLAVTGIIIGTVCSLAASRLLGSLLFAVHAWDVSTLVAVAGTLTISALLASYIPARRAASVNPVEALRTE